MLTAKRNSLLPDVSQIWILSVLVAFEVITMGFLLFAQPVTLIYYAAILLVPVFILLLPIEPTIGLVAMIVTTGLDYFGVIAFSKEAQYSRFTYFHIAIALTMVSTVLNMIARKRFTIPSFNIFPPLLCFIVMYAISFSRTVPGAATDGLITLARVALLSCVIFVVAININSRRKVAVIAASMIFTTLVLSGMTLYQIFNEGTFFAPIVIKVANTIGLPVFRASATFTNPNSLACFMMVGAVVSFALIFHKDSALALRILIFLAVIIINLGLIASFSRGGWVSTLFAVSLIVVFHKKWSYFGYFGIFLLICLVIISVKVPRLWEVVFERFGSIFNAEDDASSSGRIALIKTGIWMWMDHPIFGVGLRSFPVLFDKYIDPSMPQVLSEVREAHTIQFEILAEFGLVGVTIASWLFFTILLHGYRSIKTISDNFLKCMQIGLLSLFLGFIVNFTFATDITNNMFWMTIGMIYVVPILDKNLSQTRAVTPPNA